MVRMIAILACFAVASGAMAQEPASTSGVLRPADSTPPENLPTIVPLPDPAPISIDRVSPNADFVLPYICCSDCPAPASDDPRIELVREQYCADDDTPHSVSVQPSGGELVGPGTKPAVTDGETAEPAEVETDLFGQPALPD
jgi:hypothetical protein